MDDRIKLTPGQLRSIANIFCEKSNFMNDMLQFLSTRVDNIESLWDGAAQGSYFIQFLELQVPLNKFPQALDGIARTLDNVAQTFEDADRLLATEMADSGIHDVSGGFPPESGNSRSQRAAIQRSAALNNQIGQTNAVWNLLGTDARGAQMGNTTMGERQHTPDHPRHTRHWVPSDSLPTSPDIPIPGRQGDTLPSLLRRWIPVMRGGYLWESLGQGLPPDTWLMDLLSYIPIFNGDATRSARISSSINLMSCICMGYYSDGSGPLFDTDINPSGAITTRRLPDGHLCGDNGSQQNAARHALWVAAMTRNHGREFAQLGSDAHESNPDILRNHPRYPNYGDMQFHTLYDADMAVDLLNNRIGMEIGEREGSGEVHDIMHEILYEFHHGEGLWVVRPDIENGVIVSYSIERQNLSRVHFENVIEELNQLDREGRELSRPEPEETDSVAGFRGSPGNQ